MLDTIFLQIFDMTKVASIVILAVLLVRLCLKRVPKVFSYALWAVVLFRLLCPVSIETPVSLIPQTEPAIESYDLLNEPITPIAAIDAAQQAVGDVLNGGIGIQHVRTTDVYEDGTARIISTDWWNVWMLFGKYAWVTGIVVMLIYSGITYGKLRRKLLASTNVGDNIYIADHIDSPFVMGALRPKIYLPSSLSEKERDYIILHEQHHIRRGDHIVKLLSFAALCLHWFNPLVWVAFILSGKDMEMSCDEAVLGKLGEDIRVDYTLREPGQYDEKYYEAHKEDYPALSEFELIHDDGTYTMKWNDNGTEYVRTYKYLRVFEDTVPTTQSSKEPVMVTRYVLTNDNTATLDELWRGVASSQLGDYIDFYTIYSDKE